MNDPEEIAKRAIGLIDLTNLNDDCTPQDIDQLCANAQTPIGPVAAVCVWPRFVSQSKRLLANTDIKVATVVNFPHGGTDVKATMHETKDCVANGADEVDLVFPYQAYADGGVDTAQTMIRTIRATTDGSALLKVILETGKLADPFLIGEASKLALEEGADFIKTSTGKVEVNATLEAARIMITAIRDFGDHARGFKPAGGIRTFDDAQNYLSVAAEIMGDGWANKNTFRFGASGLLANLLAKLDLSENDGSQANY
ncbi:MAG: deoxyribose-phosphate aldolase [Pseudomonadota bacterium]